MIQNFIAKLSPNEKKIFYITAIVVILALMDRVFLGPTTDRLKSLDEDIAKEEGVIKSDMRFLAYKDKILKENVDFSNYYTQKTQAEEEIIASFLKKVEILASESKVNLAKVTPDESKQKKGYVEYYANLECEGRLEDITKFIYAVDISPELLKITKLSMNPKKAGSEDVTATMVVSKVIIDASSLKEADKITKEFGGLPKASKEESKKENPKEAGAAAGQDDIKPSVWEKFMSKSEKQPQPTDENSEVPAP